MESNIHSQRFIISAENITYKELFTQIAVSFGKKPPHKKVTSFIAEIVWRAEALKVKLTGKEPLLTKETARKAQAKLYFDSSKLLKELPGFYYIPLKESIKKICEELKLIHHL
jgi:nucleoside-diphosphate-sugar epimerase